MDLAGLRGHGLISGVTGSGKTTTAKLLAEAFSARGVPVFAVDAKGDFAGISQPEQHAGAETPRDAPPPVILWDLDGRRGFRLCLANRARVAHPPFFWSQLRRVHQDGAGYVSVLDAAELIRDPPEYAAFLSSLLRLCLLQCHGERGDLGRPRLMLILEEAHLLLRRLGTAERQEIAGTLRGLKALQVMVILLVPDPTAISDDLDALIDFRIQHSLWSVSEPTVRKLRFHFRASAGRFDADYRDAVRSLAVGEVFITGAHVPISAIRRFAMPEPTTRNGPIDESERLTIVRREANAGASPSPRRARRRR